MVNDVKNKLRGIDGIEGNQYHAFFAADYFGTNDGTEHPYCYCSRHKG